MTIRITTLSVFTLLCCMAAGMTGPRLSFAADAPGTQVQAPAEPPAQVVGKERLRLDPGPGASPADRRDALKEELMKLPPDQRRAKIEEMKKNMSANKAERLKQRKDEFQAKWDKASPEDRAKFCDNVKQKCANGGKKYACDIAEGKCQGKGQ